MAPRILTPAEAALKAAIDRNDFDAVRTAMTADPALHRAPLGYAGNGPLTWVAECRVPWEPPGPARLAMAEWMIENGSDVHQGGDGPLMRAALRGERIPMMELLVAHGADVNAEWNGDYPILWAPCESVNPQSIGWLVARGARPDTPAPGRATTALDYLIGTYGRSEELGEAIEILLAAGGTTRYDQPGVLAVLRGRIGDLEAALAADPGLLDRRYPELDCGSTGARRLLLAGATLLHVAAEFGRIEEARWMLARGADPNVRAAVDAAGVGGQTPLFHAATQYEDFGLEMARVLLAAGASPAASARIPGAYDQPEDFFTGTPLAYARRFPGDEWPGTNAGTIALLERAG